MPREQSCSSYEKVILQQRKEDPFIRSANIGELVARGLRPKHPRRGLPRSIDRWCRMRGTLTDANRQLHCILTWSEKSEVLNGRQKDEVRTSQQAGEILYRPSFIITGRHK